MLPKEAINKIRFVTVFHWTDCINGFHFLDKDKKLLWKIGNTKVSKDMGTETIEIPENQLIVGVKAKLLPGYQSAFTDFQFQLGKFA